MDDNELYARIKSILVDQFEVEEADVTLDANLYEELEIDSIDAVDLLVQLKEMTGKKIPPEKFKEVFNLKIQKVIKVPVVPINEVLAEHVPGGQKIDFMSIDVEGFEMRILKALDFDSFGPEYLLIEDLDHEGLNATDQEVLHIKDSDQNRFMESRGYKLLGKTAQTLLYSKNAG